MLRMLSGYWLSQTLYAVAALGVADRLVQGPKTAEQLAAEVGADADALFRLLRGLSSLGIFAAGPLGFALTPLSETLRSDRPDSVRPMALLGGHPIHWQAWGNLLESIRTGKTAFDLTHNQSFFEVLAEDGALARTFHEVLGRPSDADRALVDVLPLTRFERIVDVGGGSGGFARRVAEAWPRARVVLFDRPHALNAAGAVELVEPVAGDFFASVPPADVYLLKLVLHDWRDADAIRILTNCRRAMRGQGRVFVIEVVMPEDDAPSIAKTHDVNMLVLTGGRERTLGEYRALFDAAGLRLVSTAATPQAFTVLEAERAALGGAGSV